VHAGVLRSDGIGAPALRAQFIGAGLGIGDGDTCLETSFDSSVLRDHVGASLRYDWNGFSIGGAPSGSHCRFDSTRQVGISGVLPGGDTVDLDTGRLDQHVSGGTLRLDMAHVAATSDDRFHVPSGIHASGSAFRFHGATERAPGDGGLQPEGDADMVFAAGA
jgi:hypothetical protein